MASVTQLVNRIRGIEFPVLKLEMRVRQRKARPFIVMGVYAGTMSVLVLALYADWSWRGGASSRAPSDLGYDLFMWMSLLQIALICLITPNLGAGSVAREKQQLSLEMLMVTPLRASGIVLQKTVAVVIEAVILLVASVPVLSVVFMLGGVSPAEVTVAYVVLLVTACLLSALGVMWSCFLKDARTSAFASSLSMLAVYLGLPFGFDSLDSHGLGDVFGVGIAVLDVLVYAAVPIAFVFHGLLSGLVGRRIRAWATRRFRIAAWAIGYAGAIGLLSVLGYLDKVVLNLSTLSDYCTLANPLRAMSEAMDYNRARSIRFVLESAGLSAAYMYMFHRLSVTKFDRLRRS